MEVIVTLQKEVGIKCNVTVIEIEHFLVVTIPSWKAHLCSKLAPSHGNW